MEPVLEVRGFPNLFPGVKALDDVSFASAVARSSA